MKNIIVDYPEMFSVLLRIGYDNNINLNIPFVDEELNNPKLFYKVFPVLEGNFTESEEKKVHENLFTEFEGLCSFLSEEEKDIVASGEETEAKHILNEYVYGEDFHDFLNYAYEYWFV